MDEPYKNPRDMMIKPSPERQQRQQSRLRQLDFDLDQRVDTNGLNELLTKRNDFEPNPRQSPLQTKSFTKTYFYSNFCDNEVIV